MLKLPLGETILNVFWSHIIKRIHFTVLGPEF